MLAAPVEIVRNPGTESGKAQTRIQGKTRVLCSHATAAWKVRGGGAVLVAVIQPATKHTPQRNVLRYYDLESGRSRTLGALPFATATLSETEQENRTWAFALSGIGTATNTPTIIIGSVEAVTGYIENASAPAFPRGDDPKVAKLSYSRNGKDEAAPLGVLLGSDLNRIYAPPATSQKAPRYLQVFPSGRALVESNNGQAAEGTWTTDGEVLSLQGLVTPSQAAAYAVPISALTPVQGIPAGKRFSVRLIDRLSSQTARKQDRVKAVSITPVVVGSEILLPAGSTLEGHLTEAKRVGWGFGHETASLTLAWEKAVTPDGRELSLDARVYAVENAQEKVTQQGKIQGIRSTGTFGSTAENGVLSFAGIDPVAYIFAASSGSAVLGFAEPEILYPAGTELILEVARPVPTATVYPPSVGPAEHDAGGREHLQAFVHELPFQTRTKGTNKPSDITSLVFVGKEVALQRAFAAAGWLPTDDLYASSAFRTVKTLAGNQTYTQAPMSVLLLNERAPVLTLSKTTNTFSSRHHVRVFPTISSRGGQPVFTASSTQDIGIAFSRKQKTFIHQIDEHIDNERSKIINDLVFTGCVDSLDLVQRPWVPRDAYNSTGDRLLTDGQAAVLHLNSCDHPRTTPSTPAPAPNRLQRSTRDTLLTVRNTVYRGNLVYQGIAASIAAHNYLKQQTELQRSAGAWRKTDASGADYVGFGKAPGVGADSPELHRRSGDAIPASTVEDRANNQRAVRDHRWDPPRYEFALQGGYMHMRSSYLTAVGVLESSSVPTKDAYFLFLADDVGDGWAAGGSVTINSWKHFSNEFAYFRQQVKYQLKSVNAALPPDQDVVLSDKDLDSDRIGLVTRQFEYNLLMHATRPASRWRPYAAVGPVLQLVALNGAPLNKPAGVFTLGLKSIGLFKAAFDFGRTPPLDGGGIFHFGFQYGAGLKYRVSPRVMMRADWRETWAKNPDIIAQSYEDYDPSALDETYTTQVVREGPEKKFIKERFTLGIAFTF